MRQRRPMPSVASSPSSSGASRRFSSACGSLTRIVVHHQRAKGRHHLHHAGDSGLFQPVRQRHDEPAQALVDAIAELDDEGGVAAGKEAGLVCGWHGLNNRHHVAL